MYIIGFSKQFNLNFRNLRPNRSAVAVAVAVGFSHPTLASPLLPLFLLLLLLLQLLLMKMKSEGKKSARHSEREILPNREGMCRCKMFALAMKEMQQNTRRPKASSHFSGSDSSSGNGNDVNDDDGGARCKRATMGRLAACVQRRQQCVLCMDSRSLHDALASRSQLARRQPHTQTDGPSSGHALS